MGTRVDTLITDASEGRTNPIGRERMKRPNNVEAFKLTSVEYVIAMKLIIKYFTF